jgi:2-deoxy-D-gluconate 3-dehydrogenase
MAGNQPRARSALFDLGGRVAIVTGGGSGIGLAIAHGLAAAGASVVIAARDAARGQTAVAELEAAGAQASFLPLDLADPDSCRALIPAAVASAGRVDILVNNAGTIMARAPQDIALEEWRMTLDVNLTGAFLLCQAAYAEFCRLGAGKIINVGSMATLFGSASGAAYCASKGGIGQLTKALAVAWGADNVQVNAILPGYINTDLTAQARLQRPGFDERVIAGTPARRFGEPGDLQGAAIFLASAASDFVTGALLPVDGGYMSQL